jgi:hypothetical protein
MFSLKGWLLGGTEELTDKNEFVKRVNSHIMLQFAGGVCQLAVITLKMFA